MFETPLPETRNNSFMVKPKVSSVDTHGQARGTCQTQALLDALRANSHSPTAKAVELCPSGRLERRAKDGDWVPSFSH